MVKHLATSPHDTLDSIGYPRTKASGESLTTNHRLLHASGPHPTPPPDDPNRVGKRVKVRHLSCRVSMTFRVIRANLNNQDLGLIHSTNGNHLESPTRSQEPTAEQISSHAKQIQSLATVANNLSKLDNRTLKSQKGKPSTGPLNGAALPAAGYPVAKRNNAQRFPRLVPVATSKRSVATYSNDVAPLTSLPSRNITTQPDASTGTLTRIDHSSRLPIQKQQLFAKYQSQLQCSSSRNIRNTSRNISNNGVSSLALPKQATTVFATDQLLPQSSNTRKHPELL
ncbi:hypothetical protein F511_30936 [Dorcoceras hygrometricum]|uniref:Uncharacterized protein n=1 Tax=Dorcoceras hygrometricum TaxID=472368 RepID=A0A2Z7AFD6_9LAMI|nr:hypothetical protein F511_30936 [Dorcoceras hygrometricum]